MRLLVAALDGGPGHDGWWLRYSIGEIALEGVRMRVVLGSKSAIKIAAVNRAFDAAQLELVLIPVAASSNVAEQPVNEEAVWGAINRVVNARAAEPGADLYLAVENGIFEEDGIWVDRAIALIVDPAGSRMVMRRSGGVQMPAKAVEAARSLGFNEVTVGKVLLDLGLVSAADDPHLELSGTPRLEFLAGAIEGALECLHFHSPDSDSI